MNKLIKIIKAAPRIQDKSNRELTVDMMNFIKSVLRTGCKEIAPAQFVGKKSK